MARAVNIAEPYASRTLTGAATLRRVVLSGWGASASALAAFTDNGRLWWRYTASSALLEFFRHDGLAASHRVAFGTVALGVCATLTADNASGFSGSCELDAGQSGVNPSGDATGDLIVSYASENDLRNAMRGSPNWLDATSKWEGQATRFEALLAESKVELDEVVAGRLAGRLPRDAMGRRALCAIASPRQLARVHALYTVYMMERYRVGNNPERRDACEFWKNEALTLLSATHIALDYEGDDSVDLESTVSAVRLGRA